MNLGKKPAMFGGGATAAAAVAGLANSGLSLEGLSAPTAPSYVPGAAGVLSGNYSYRVSFYNEHGDSGYSPISTGTDLVSQKAVVTVPISSDSRCVGRNLWRTKIGDGSGDHYLVASIPDNVTTVFQDNTPDSSLGKTGHYLSTLLGYTVPALKSNNANLLKAYGLSLLIGEWAGDALLNPEAQVVENIYNYAIGGSALRALVLGGFNIAIGGGAGQQLTHGGYTTLIGHKAGRKLDYANSNTFVGSFAGENSYITDNNVFVGASAGQDNTSGSGGVVVGAGSNTGNFSNTIVLGTGATATADNQCMVKAGSLELVNAGGNVVLKSPNGTRYKLSISDAGVLSASEA